VAYVGASTAAVALGSTIVNVALLLHPGGWIFTGLFFVGCIISAAVISNKEYAKNLAYLKEQYDRMKVEISKGIEIQYSEVDRLILKIKRFLDEYVTSVIDLITRDKSKIEADNKTLSIIRDELRISFGKLYDYFLINKLIN
jgi:hypothetical protein